MSSARPTPTMTFFQSSLFRKDEHRHRTVEFHFEDEALCLLRGDEVRTAVPDSPHEIAARSVPCPHNWYRGPPTPAPGTSCRSAPTPRFCTGATYSRPQGVQKGCVQKGCVQKSCVQKGCVIHLRSFGIVFVSCSACVTFLTFFFSRFGAQ